MIYINHVHCLLARQEEIEDRIKHSYYSANKNGGGFI